MVSSRPRDATGVIVGVIVVVILLITIAVISVVIVLKRKSMMKGLHQLYNNVTEFFNPYNDHGEVPIGISWYVYRDWHILTS